MKKIEFFKHNLSEEDKKECLKILDSIFLTTGEEVKIFEKKFADYTGNRFAVGLTSCTDALFLALKYFNIGKGDEVITTPLSFISTANVIEMCNAKPVFVDVEEDTGNINAELIKSAITNRTRAIIVVHLYGQMCNMQKISKIAKNHSIKIIEDCAHCIEGSRNGIKPGQLGDVACFSFYATKNITSGEGGAIICNDEKIYNWFKKARLHGMSKNAEDRYSKKYEHYDMEFLGYKCNMTNIQASLLIHQLDRIGKNLKRREAICSKYMAAFSKNRKISYPAVLSNTKHARYVFTIWVNPKKRDVYMHALQNAGIGIAVNFRPIHLMDYYRKKYLYHQGDFPLAEKIGNSTITIPLYPKLTGQEINYIIKIVSKISSQ